MGAVFFAVSGQKSAVICQTLTSPSSSSPSIWAFFGRVRDWCSERWSSTFRCTAVRTRVQVRLRQSSFSSGVTAADNIEISCAASLSEHWTSGRMLMSAGVWCRRKKSKSASWPWGV